jgi:RNA polymerase sigma factor (sigma-70 family)
MAMLRSRLGGGVVHHLERLFGPGTVTGLTEGQLLERFATGRDESAFEALVGRHGPMVLGVCRQILRDPNDVDDAFQATFLVLVRKAGALRQKELLGNWLYGVACRVSLRARSVATRRQSRFIPTEDVEKLAADRRLQGSGSVPQSVQDDEERPFLHEEVNRLPRKYRTPIVLCYFEGLTHDQAAARLGWPVGTVKGRLSRARDLLRSRLSRRGVTVSATALTAHLASSEVKASVPASLTHSTLKAALAVAPGAGAALTASSAISLPVASLTEGVLQAMVLSHVKMTVIPVLVAVGMLTTGASVVAYQFGPAAASPAGESPITKVSRSTTVAGTQPADRTAQSDIQAARLQLENLRKLYSQGIEGMVIDPSHYNNWSLNLLVSEMLAAPGEDSRTKALEGHRDRLASLIKELSPLSESGKISKNVITAFESYLKRAESMLAQAHQAQGGTMMGMMSNVNSAGARMGGMGGMGGGGGRDEGPDPRVEIARMAAAISSVDKSPRNQAILKTLDEPVTLHFAVETPLEEVLKHIKDNLKGPDGKKLPIYVDPEGLQEAEKTMASPVTIDLEDIPLKFSLRLVLKQLGLAYCVRDGVLIISSVEGIQQELKEAESEQRGLHPEHFTRGLQ